MKKLKTIKQNTQTSDEIELCTFPDDDRDYCKCFKVPREWLLELLEALDRFNERKGVNLERFLDNYVWDETWFIYLQAKSNDMIISEVEQK